MNSKHKQDWYVARQVLQVKYRGDSNSRYLNTIEHNKKRLKITPYPKTRITRITGLAYMSRKGPIVVQGKLDFVEDLIQDVNPH